jgi:hypothetical protein
MSREPKRARRRRRAYSHYLATGQHQTGFSEIAPSFWQTAEKLRSEAVEATSRQTWKAHSSVPSAICLYHAALECFINEQVALAIALKGGTRDVIEAGHSIQDDTLCEAKLKVFFSFFGLEGKETPEVHSRALLFLRLRDRLYHHSPEIRDLREYPDDVIAALKDAGIESVDTSWAGQCMNVRLADWASDVVHTFIEDWCQALGIPSRMQLPGWKVSNAAPTQQPTSMFGRVASSVRRALRRIRSTQG